MMKLLRDLRIELDIKLPIKLRIVDSKSKFLAEYEGIYSRQGNLKTHRITFFTRNFQDGDRDFNTILAHEMIHAWQEEHNIQSIHGKDFQQWAEYLESVFDMPNIYDPECDMD